MSEGAHRNEPFRRWQRLAWWVAAVSGLLGLATATGCGPLPPGPPSAAWPAHLLVLLAGAAGGVATLGRAREADRRRWEALAEPMLTSGERQWAHREAEGERRTAATAFLIGPLFLAYWLANQLSVPDRFDVADLLVATPLVGYVVGLALGRRWVPEEGPPDG